MSFIESSLKPNAFVDNDSDIGSGALASLAAEGYPAAVQGFDSANFNQNYGKDGFIYSKGSGNLFMIGPGSAPGSKVAVRVASGSAAALVGAAVKYLVYPSTWAPATIPTGAYTSIGAAIAAANLENPAQRVAIIIMPGVYNESFSVRDGMSITGVGSVNETGAAGVNIVGDGVSPAITVPQSCNATIQNVRVDGNTQRCVSFANAAGLSTVTINECQFDTSAVALETAGASSVLALVMVDCRVSAGGIDLSAAAIGSLNVRGCRITGNVSVGTLTGFQSQLLNTVSVNGTTQISQCRIGASSSSTGSATVVDCVFTGGFTFNASSSIRGSYFAGTVNFGAAATTSILDQCSIQTLAGDGVTIGAGHIVNFRNTEIIPFTGTAISGTGSALIYGGLPGAGIVTLPFANVTGISAQIVHPAFDYTLVIAPTVNTWPTSNPDRVRATPVNVTAADSLLELPSADNQVPGREIMVRNVSAANFMTVQPAAGDTLFDGSASGNVIMPPGDYRRFIANPGTGWEVN